jgi:hypothetical protein
VKRGTTALAVLSVCVLPGCGTQPPKLEYADGPGPYNFDCNAKAGYYDDLNIHAPNGKLRLAGFVQVDSVAARPDPRWITQTEVFLLGPTLTPFVSLLGVRHSRCSR